MVGVMGNVGHDSVGLHLAVHEGMRQMEEPVVLSVVGKGVEVTGRDWRCLMGVMKL